MGKICEDNVKAYEFLQVQNIEELNSTGYLLKHKKTGANVVVIENDDENKVFSIGFRTPPVDDTGLPHILEHSVLCGSDKYPSKNPFEELAQGSLNTYLNAMTYPDKTVYPVASCNDLDFKNLMDVYLDAVFHPNVRKIKEIFMQEGWHYELSNEDEPLKINGVVYNEMKGALSEPGSLLERYMLSDMFPDTCYSLESGGDPTFIPDLSYEEFISFYNRYYHPSNSYIYLYGNADMVERLEYLDKEYLSGFEKIEIDSKIEFQKPFDKPKFIENVYPIGDDEDEKDKGYLAYSVTAGTALDRDYYYAFKVLAYALLNMPGAPLKQALVDAGIGKSIQGGFCDGILQCKFDIIAKNVEVSKRDEFVKIIENTLSKIVEEGIDKNSLKAALNVMEFQYREADFGNYPRGLFYGLYILDSWLYDENQPFMNVMAAETFKKLNELANTDYFENLIKEFILGNNHKLVYALAPKKGLSEEKDKALCEKLAKIKESLSKDEILGIIENTKTLEKYQSEPSPKEDIEKLPVLKISDIKKEPKLLNYEVKDFDGVKVIHTNIHTNGIAYIKASFDCNNVPNRLLPYMGLLENILKNMDTENYKYADLNNEINMHTGGMSTHACVYNKMKVNGSDRTYDLKYDVDIKTFYPEIPFAFKIMEEVILHTVVEDEKRLKEIIDETKGKIRSRIISSGHLASMYRCMSYVTEPGYITDLFYGVGAYEFFDKLDKEFNYDEIVKNLRELMKYVFNKNNVIIAITVNDEAADSVKKEMNTLISKLYTDKLETKTEAIELQVKNEGIVIPSPVSYVARVGNFKKLGHKYSGAMLALKNALDYGYLWNNVRVLGGAYGTMSLYQATSGNLCYMSYRDPNVLKTYETYGSVPSYLREMEADEREIRKYIIGAISTLDTPLTARAEGERSYTCYVNLRGNDDLKTEREQVLNLTLDDLKACSDVVEDVLNEGYVCVVGNKEKIEEASHLFKEIKNIF